MVNEMLNINDVNVKVFKFLNKESGYNDIFAFYHKRLSEVKVDDIENDIIGHFLKNDDDNCGMLNIIVIPWSISLKDNNKILKYASKQDKFQSFNLGFWREKKAKAKANKDALMTFGDVFKAVLEKDWDDDGLWDEVFIEDKYYIDEDDDYSHIQSFDDIINIYITFIKGNKSIRYTLEEGVYPLVEVKINDEVVNTYELDTTDNASFEAMIKITLNDIMTDSKKYLE